MYWDSYSSYFQLSAAFCLSYAVNENFHGGFDKSVIKIQNNNVYKSLVRSFGSENAVKQNTKVGKFTEDPAVKVLLQIMKNNRTLFFHTFIASVLFLILAAFERFYLFDDLATSLVSSCHKKFCVLIVVPFLILWFNFFRHLVVMPVLSTDEIYKLFEKKDLNTNDGSNQPTIHMPLSLFFSTIILSLAISFYLHSNNDCECFFTPNIQKFIITFCIISTWIPFLTQGIQFFIASIRINKTSKKYVVDITAKDQTNRNELKDDIDNLPDL